MRKVLSLLFVAFMAIGLQAQNWEWREIDPSSSEPDDFYNVPIAEAWAVTPSSEKVEETKVGEIYFYAYDGGIYYVCMSATGGPNFESWSACQSFMSSCKSVYEGSGAEIHFYYPASTAAPVTLTSLEVTGTAEYLWKGDAFTHNGITVTAYYSDETSQDVTNLATYTGYDMSVAGDQIVTVTYETLSKPYPVIVKTIANSQAYPYTIEEAMALYDAGKDLATEVYIEGMICYIEDDAYDVASHSITYTISADGIDSGDRMTMFGGKDIGGADFAAKEDVELMARVVVYGSLVKYSALYGLDDGNCLVSYEAPVGPQDLKMEITDVVFSQDGTMVTISLAKDAAPYIDIYMAAKGVSMIQGDYNLEGQMLHLSDKTLELKSGSHLILTHISTIGDDVTYSFTFNASTLDGIYTSEGLYVSDQFVNDRAAATNLGLIMNVFDNDGTTVTFNMANYENYPAIDIVAASKGADVLAGEYDCTGIDLYLTESYTQTLMEGSKITITVNSVKDNMVVYTFSLFAITSLGNYFSNGMFQTNAFVGDRTSTDIIESDLPCRDGKFFENGQVIILRNGVKFNAMGQRVE